MYWILKYFCFLQQSVRPVSPSPSNISTTSSTSLVSEGRKSTNSAGQQSGAKKFGKLKFGFSEKATKFEKNLCRTFDKSVMFYERNSLLVKTSMKIFQNKCDQVVLYKL